MQKKKFNKETTALPAFNDFPFSEFKEKDIIKFMKEKFPATLRTFDEIPISEMTKKEIKKYLKEKFTKAPLKFENYLRNDFMDDEIKIKWKKGKEFMKTEIISDEGNYLAEFMALPKKIRKKLIKQKAVLKDQNGVIVFMALPVMVRTLIATMPLKGSKADYTKEITDIINKAKVSEYVTIDPGIITTMLGQAKTFGDSTASSQPEAWRQINNSMKAMMGEFQIFANNNPFLARDAITSAGFSIKKITPRGPQKWSVKNTAWQGTLALRATGSRKRSFHVWYISMDGATYEIFDITLGAETMLQGYAEGLLLYFRHQLYTKDGPEGFDDVIDITVSRVRN